MSPLHPLGEQTCNICVSTKEVRPLPAWNNDQYVNHYCKQHYREMKAFNDQKKQEFIQFYSDEKNRTSLKGKSLDLYNRFIQEK